MALEDRIRQALRDCIDPTIPLNLVDLGCVESISVAADAEAPGAGIPGVPPRFRAWITLLPASDDASVRAQVAALVQNRLAGLAELSRAAILMKETWSAARITPAGRRLLKLDFMAFPILNNRVR